MDFYDVREKVNSDTYKNKMQYPNTRKYPVDFIFDEDRSVKWNREQVEIKNKESKVAMDIYRAHDRELSVQFDSDCIEAIMDYMRISKEKAKIIFNKAWDDGHSSGYNEVISYAEDYCELINEILK